MKRNNKSMSFRLIVWIVKLVRQVTFLVTVFAAPAYSQGLLQSFDDVPTNYWAYQFIEIMASEGVTSGCGDGNYCPDASITRAQMAVFLERGMNGDEFVPPSATGNVFSDIGAGDFAANFIEQLFADGITAGCGNGRYCPNREVTRDQMAVFLLRAKYGADYSPPAPAGVFNDVPTSHWAAAWIEKLDAEGITVGCGGGNYCPTDAVTRDQMAVFLVRTFELGGFVYVTDPNNRRIITISMSTLLFGQAIATAEFPQKIAFTQDGFRLFAQSGLRGFTVAVPGSMTVDRDFSATTWPIKDFVISPDGSIIYALTVEPGSDSNAEYPAAILIVSAADGALIEQLDAGTARPAFKPYVDLLRISPDGSHVYYMEEGTANEIAVISTATNTFEDPIAGLGGDSSRGFLLNADGSRAFVISQDNVTLSGRISVIDLQTKQVDDVIVIGDEPNSIALSPDETEVWVTCGLCAAAVWTADLTVPNPVATELALPASGRILAFSPDGTRAFVVTQNLGSIAKFVAIDTGTRMIVKDTFVSGDLFDIAYDKDGQTAFLLGGEPWIVTAFDVETGADIQSFGIPGSNFLAYIAVTPP